MKFSVARDELYQALQKIVGVVPAKTTTPILYDILFRLSGNELELIATDLEILTKTKIEVWGENDGAIAIPAKVLNEILRELKNVDLTFELEDSLRVFLKTDWGEYRITGDAGEDFPLMPVEEFTSGFEMESDVLARMIEKTIFAVSRDELRPALMGILFQIRENELRLVGTDGHRLSRVIYRSFSSERDTDIIVPTKALSLLDKNLRSSEGTVRSHYGENFVVFDLGNLQIYSRLVESQYPEYEQVIPVDSDKELLVDTREFLGSIRRVSVFSGLLTNQVLLNIADGEMEVFSQDVDMGGEGRERLKVEFQGEPIRIGFNAQYLIDILKHIDTDQTKILMSSPMRPAMVLPSHQHEGEEHLMLLMPVRIATEEETEEEPYSSGTSPGDEANEVDF